MIPVLNESTLSIDIASCPKDKARTFVRSTGFFGPYQKAYNTDGIAPSGARKIEGVLHEWDRTSVYNELRPSQREDRRSRALPDVTFT